ncbi:MAG: hypothetical protein AUG51_00775 [Acidobacteria bacterium 13_1_20CM_3_53_8]|nr:MAG: hypothetical protein AUG51_00775 [Acidobacteria bacterium 13_1_20CM_3_53_8]
MTPTRTAPIVLAVNDDQRVLELLVVLLEQEGYHVVSADDGQRALELAVEVEPDIIISDVVMPQMDGLEFCRLLKQDARTAHVPVLLVSAVRTSEIDNLHGLVAGADDYLEIPFRRQELSVKVARLTERHRVERHYREIVEQAPDIIFSRDMQGHITSMNEAGACFFGRPASELIGIHLSKLLGEELAEQDIAEVATRATDEPVRQVHLLSDASGVPHYLEDITTIERDARGIPVGVRGVVRDITEQKRAEERLRESEERYRELFENANDIIYTHDLKGNFTSLNRTGERITGYSREEATRMNIAQVVAPGHLEQAREMIARKTSEDVSTVYELEIVAKDGRHVALEVSTRLIYRNGQPVGVQGIGRDITERKRAEEALAQQVVREALINRISSAVRRSLDPVEVFRTAVRELGSHLSVDRCSIFMKFQRAGVVRNVAEYHAEGVKPANKDFPLAQLSEFINGIAEHGVLAFNDAANDERINELYQNFLRMAGVRSIMYVAIRVGDDMPAAFVLSTTRSVRRWSDADIALARAIADHTGLAIRQAELYQKAEATSVREKLVNRLSLAIRASLSMPEVLETATRELGHALAASRVYLRIYDSANTESQTSHEYVAKGVVRLSDAVTSYGDPVGQRLLRAQRPIVIDDSLNCSVGGHEFNSHVRAYAERNSVRSEILYPLVVNDRFRGALCIHQTDRVRHWSEDEVALVESVAAQLAIGISQAELFEITKRAQKDWEATFNAMSEGIFIFDDAGRLARVNRAGAALEDSWPHLLLGRRCCDILRANSDGECLVGKSLSEGRSMTVEVTPERANRPLLITVEPVMDAGGRAVGVVCTARDLSELRKVEAVARERQSLLTHILESVREPICALDTKGHFLWCNTASTTTSGYRQEDLIGHSFTDMIYSADREMAQENFESALGGEPRSYEVRYTRRDGEVRDALFYNAPLVIDNVTTGVLGIVRDITEQKQQQQRAAQADKLRALGQLASGVAHDFNNALAAILGRAQLIRRYELNETLSRNLDIIQTAAEDAAATVRRIQTFARKSQENEFELLEVRGLLLDATEITRTRWKNEARLRGLEYDVEVEQTPAPLYTFGNASELREVFVNLIVNAVDAMPAGGHLSIGIKREDDRLRLRFKDTGIGMTDEVRERIFEPFYTTKGAQGTGLGLAVSYGIIERHSGLISVKSELGRGTTFTIDLPATEPAQKDASETSMVIVKTPSLRVLVVDDEPSVRETLAEMLKHMSHTVMSAESGRAALEILDEEGFDLVFTDLSMPEMDGWEMAREIRRRWPATDIVLVTGYGKATTPPPGEQTLVNGIIGKPFDFDQVTEIINDLTGKERELETPLPEINVSPEISM